MDLESHSCLIGMTWIQVSFTLYDRYKNIQTVRLPVEMKKEKKKKKYDCILFDVVYTHPRWDQLPRIVVSILLLLKKKTVGKREWLLIRVATFFFVTRSTYNR